MRALAVAVLVLVGAACGGGSGGGGSAQTTTFPMPERSGVEVRAPSGWTTQEVAGGLIVAKKAEDIGTKAPSGPRLTARSGQGKLASPEALFAAGKVADISVQGKPEDVTVGGRNGVAFEYSSIVGGARIFARQVVVPLGHGEAEVFLLEAPEFGWIESRAALEAVLSSVRFTSRAG